MTKKRKFGTIASIKYQIILDEFNNYSVHRLVGSLKANINYNQIVQWINIFVYFEVSWD